MEQGQLMNKAKMPAQKMQKSMPMPKAPKSLPAGDGKADMLQKMLKPMKPAKPIKALPDTVKPLKQREGGLRDILKNNFMKWRDTVKDKRLA